MFCGVCDVVVGGFDWVILDINIFNIALRCRKVDARAVITNGNSLMMENSISNLNMFFIFDLLYAFLTLTLNHAKKNPQ